MKSRLDSFEMDEGENKVDEKNEWDAVSDKAYKLTVKQIPQIKANPAKQGEVYLLEDNILTQNNGRTLDYLKLLEPDRMLYAFRTTFGVDTKNVLPLGGWDEPLGLLRGHSMGHFLSGLALAYKATRDQSLKEKADYLIDSLRELQILSKGNASEFKSNCTKEDVDQSKWSSDPGVWGEGYLSAYPPDQFALLEQYTPYPTIWAPYYTLHKIIAGLIDCYEYVENKTALIIACGIGDWVYDRLSRCTRVQLEKMWSMYIAGEYGGMNEVLSQLFIITKNPKYLESARLFDNPKVFSGLANNKDTIATLHANQHIPQMIGALKEYIASEQVSYYQTAYHFWNLVTKHYAYSTGGVGRAENFQEADILAAHIEGNRNCETCAAYNMLKLTRDLYCYDPDEKEYMDYFERTFFNHIVASQNPIVTEDMHHGVTYMLPIGPGQHKEYGSDYQEFTCCHGAGMENHVKYQESIYFTYLAEEILSINLYIPSKIDWKERGITLTQSGGFPSEKIKITVSGSSYFTCRLRIPDWCKNEFLVFLNGKVVENITPIGGYLTLTRSWVDADILEVFMPYHIYLDYTPDSLDLPLASVMYGPFVMVAEDSSSDWITLRISSDLRDDFIVVWEEGMPVLYYDELKFIPMYAAHHIDYHTYFKIKFPH